MDLPLKPLSRDTVEVNDVPVEYRAMSRHECMHVLGEPDSDAAENYVVSKGTGVDLTAAAKWLDSVDVVEGKKLIDAILTLSGIAKPKPGEAPKG